MSQVSLLTLENFIYCLFALYTHEPLIYCQIATIGLAADENPLGVVLGGVVYD